MQINVGDVIKLKKKHPCGSFQWTVLRTGTDIKLKCLGCEHEVMLKRSVIEKSIKK